MGGIKTLPAPTTCPSPRPTSARTATRGSWPGRFKFADDCTSDFIAPQVVVLESGHDGWVVGGEAAVLIEFDFAQEMLARLGLPEVHRHD